MDDLVLENARYSNITVQQKRKLAKKNIFFAKGDITTFKGDVIVNAANTRLLGGGGVDGAIHRSAGSELLKECKLLGGCKTGYAKITKAYNLPCKNVIHAVGPIYDEDNDDNAILLQSAYFQSLELAKQNNLETVAFPAISCGVYSYPIKEACEIAVNTVLDYLYENINMKVLFVLFLDEHLRVYSDYIKSI